MVFRTPVLDKNRRANSIPKTASVTRTYQFGAKSENPKGEARSTWSAAIYSVQSQFPALMQMSAGGTNI